MITYLLHFDKKIGTTGKGTAQHYLGSTTDLERRLKWHRKGWAGSHIVRAFHRAGIGFRLARTWETPDRSLERQMKKNHHIGRACPICRQERRKEARGQTPSVHMGGPAAQTNE